MARKGTRYDYNTLEFVKVEFKERTCFWDDNALELVRPLIKALNHMVNKLTGHNHGVGCTMVHESR